MSPHETDQPVDDRRPGDPRPDDQLVVVPRQRAAGRPLDDDLTERLRERATTLLITRGSTGLTANVLAEHTRAGKAGIYRRWPDMRALEAELMGRVQLLPDADSTQLPCLAVRTLAESWTRPPNRDQQLAASLLGQAVQDPEVRRALHAHLRDGLAAWWVGLGGSVTQDAPVLHLARALLVAHWVSGPLDRTVTAAFVDLALAALTARTPEPAAR